MDPTHELVVYSAVVSRRRYLDAAALLVGLGVLIYVFSREPLGAIADAIGAMSGVVFLSPIVMLLWFPAHAVALWELVDRAVPLPALLYQRFVGEGYNALLPMAGLGGEPFKLRHLGRYLPTEAGVAALLRDRVIDNAVGFACYAGCLALTLPNVELPSTMLTALWVFVAIAAALAILSIWLVGTRMPGRLGRKLGKWLGGSDSEPPPLAGRLLVRAIAWSIVSRVINYAETSILLAAVGAPHGFAATAFVDGAMNAAGFVGFAIPQGIGVVEGSSVYILGALGVAGPGALAFALARRARILVLALVGVAMHLTSTVMTRRRRG